MRYQQSIYLAKYKKQLWNGEKCEVQYTKSNTSAHTDNNIRTKRRSVDAKGKSHTWKILFPLCASGRGPEVVMTGDLQGSDWTNSGQLLIG